MNAAEIDELTLVIEAGLRKAWEEGYRAAEAFWTEGTGRLPENPYGPPTPDERSSE